MLKVRVKRAASVKRVADLRRTRVVICEHLKQIFSINKSINSIQFGVCSQNVLKNVGNQTSNNSNGQL